MSRYIAQILAMFWAMCLVSSAFLSFAFSIAPNTMTNLLMGLVAIT